MAEQQKSLQELISTNKEDLFKELKEEVDNDQITDVDWCGNNLWITELSVGRYLSKKKLSDKYVTNLAVRLGNMMKQSLNRENPVLEANTDTLRISIWHESRCGEKSICLRKIPDFLRFGHKELIESAYAPDYIINLLENCVTAHVNTVIGGQPHAGKTELLKYLATFIPANEKVGIYEDNQEIHYKKIHPDRCCDEFFVDEKYPYSDIIKAGLRHNIEWILLSESRGPEVIDLLNSLSTGGHCMTTIHLDDVKDLPDRMYNMLGTSLASDRFINNIYNYIGVGVLVDCDIKERRRIKQVAFYSHDKANGENKCTVIYENGELTNKKIPDEYRDAFKKYGIDDPYR